MTKNNSPGATLLAFLAVLLLIPFIAIIGGWALQLLWLWFVVPAFHLPALTIPIAIGIGLVGSLLSHQYVPRPEGDVWKPIWFQLALPLICLAMGWITRLFL